MYIKQLLSALLFLFISFQSNAQFELVVSGFEQPNEMVLYEGYIYVSEYTTGEISKFNITEVNPTIETVITGLGGPTGLHLEGSILYIADYLNGTVSKADLSESNPTATLLLENISLPNGLYMIDDELYIAGYGSGEISKIDPSLPNPVPEVVVSGLSAPTGMLLIENELHVVENGSGRISKFDITDPTSTPEVVIEGLNIPSRGIVLIDSVMYCSEYIGNKVSSFKFYDSAPFLEDFAVDLDGPTQMKLFGNELFLVENGTGSILKLEVELPVSTNELEQANQIVLYPNPAGDYFYLKNTIGTIDVQIFDMLGVSVKEVLNQTGELVDISMVPQGNYTVVVDATTTLRFVKL